MTRRRSTVYLGPLRIREDHGRWFIESFVWSRWGARWRPRVMHHRTEASARDHVARIRSGVDTLPPMDWR